MKESPETDEKEFRVLSEGKAGGWRGPSSSATWYKTIDARSDGNMDDKGVAVDRVRDSSEAIRLK